MDDNNYLKGVDELSGDAQYRAAFPSYKVFIYGHDITGDVMSVRINQSGGSLERTPSTCTISLANYREKYTLTHKNMIVVGALKNDIASKNGKGTQTAKDYLNSYDPAGFGYEYANPYLGNPIVPTEGSTKQLSGQLGTYLAGLEPDKKREMILRFSTATDDEVRYLLEAEGLTINSAEEARTLASLITTAKMEEGFSRLMEFGGPEFTLGELGDSDLNYSIKDDVIRDKIKLENTQTLAPNKYYAVSRVVKQQEGFLFEYPMAEGDLIFNLNDPVRVAFRDPFDPRMWYWMFTGFVDAWTEDVGANLDSTVTINCTDVTKMARYTVSNIRAGIGDANIDKILSGLNDSGTGESEQSNIRMTKDIFAGLQVSEILELNFFGSESATSVATASRSVEFGIDAFEKFFEDFLVSNQITNVDQSTSTTIETAKIEGFISKFGLSPDQVRAAVYLNADVPNSYSAVKSKVSDILSDKIVSNTKSAVTQLRDIKWHGITAPRDVPFKRRSSEFGIHFYVYGEPDAYDESLGAKKIDSFWQWNEVLHHRVQKTDLTTMQRLKSDTAEGLYGVFDTPADNASDKKYPASANYTIEQIIDIIGKDLKTFPVGHGRVFYLAPARMHEYDVDGIVDRGMGGTGNFHSVFKDRLSLLYDIAQAIEWRFYATPKGDVVFEHPLYDHDPAEFFYPIQLSGYSLETNANVSSADNLKVYEDIFSQEYSGSYSESEAEDLTDFIFKLNTDNQDLVDFMEDPVFDYSHHFTIGIDEQLSFSNTNSDKGLLTVYRVKPHNVGLWSEADVDAARQFVYAIDKTLIPTLGFRIMDGAVESYVDTAEGGLLFGSLKLRQINSEARSVGIDTVPKFGLMVNRPLLWRYRNYYANVVSCSHSIAWNSDVTSSVNLNQIRAWSGEIENKRPKYYHFGGGEKAFSWTDFMSKSKNNPGRKEGVE